MSFPIEAHLCAVATFNILLFKVWSLTMTHLFNYMPLLSLIGLVILMIASLLVVMQSFWIGTWSLENLAIKKILPTPFKSENKKLVDGATKLTWIQSLLGELGTFLSHSPMFWRDNLCATYL